MARFPSLQTEAGARALTEPQRALLARLQAYAPDAPDAPQPHSRRLADAQGWTHAHALAVIDEYKRFAFLAQAAGHPVTPSHAVDAAWHLHLQYTREYWDVFCAGVLRAPLHHMPGTGASDEAAIYAEYYRRTLDSYRRLFGSEPPETIWPRPAAEPARAPDDPHPAPHTEPPRAPPAAHRLRRLTRLAWPAALASVAATCAYARDLNVLNYSGPEFLALYMLACMAALLLIAALQRLEHLCRPWGTRPRESSPDLSAEEAGYLAGGASRMTQVATLSLLQADAIRWLQIHKHDARVQATGSAHAGPLADEWAWLNAQPGGETTYGAFRARLAQREPGIVAGLRRNGWLWAPGDLRAARWAARAIALLVLGTGAAKLAVGLVRGRPVLLLMICMAAFAIGYRIMSASLSGFRRGGVTHGGQAAFDAHCDARQGDHATPDALLWTAALFGVGALAGTAWSAYTNPLMAPLMAPLATSAAANGGGSSGSDSGGSRCSSDSGSSSCSSSSCGSSGCGGCSSS
ncbi:TIGR04222 domain-containing membrane protein [Burkholderia sp. SRS-46]|nr:TIGR04222 domain-containing membrane protein [Burkholderia sp. SRS-46]